MEETRTTRASNAWRRLAFAGLALAGCSSGSAAPDATVCTRLATSYCAKFATCSPFLTTLLFGDPASCHRYIDEHCRISLAAPGTGLTSAAGSACEQELAALPCGQFTAGDLARTACIPHGGAVRAGGACGDDWQCAGGRCSIVGDTGCGVCTDPVGEGDTCAGDGCAAGLTCVFDRTASSGRCLPPFPAGGACDSTRPCAESEVCQRPNLDGDQGSCQPLRQVGQSCRPDVVACDYNQNAQCSPVTNQCELPSATVQPGQPCGWIDGHYAFCNGLCAEPSPSSTAGTCMALEPRIAQGRPCAGADACALGTSCVGGICALPDPSRCTPPPS